MAAPSGAASALLPSQTDQGGTLAWRRRQCRRTAVFPSVAETDFEQLAVRRDQRLPCFSRVRPFFLNEIDDLRTTGLHHIALVCRPVGKLQGKLTAADRQSGAGNLPP